MNGLKEIGPTKGPISHPAAGAVVLQVTSPLIGRTEHEHAADRTVLFESRVVVQLGATAVGLQVDRRMEKVPDWTGFFDFSLVAA